MSNVLARVQGLAAVGEAQASLHGSRELAADGIMLDEVLAGLTAAIVVEDYPGYAKGPSVLVLQHDATGWPIHILWGIAKGRDRPPVLITAYRPDPERWSADFLKRVTP